MNTENTDIQQSKEYFPNQVIHYNTEEQHFTFTTENNVSLRLSVVSDSIIRFRYSTTHRFQNDFSYALSDTFQPETATIDFQENPDNYIIFTSKIACHISKTNLKIKIYDQNGQLILEDEKGFHWEEHQEFGGNFLKISKVCREYENYFGLGDKATHLNIKGKAFENWNTDQYLYVKDKDPLYKTIPFYIGLHQGLAYGIFLDNTFRTTFDFGKKQRYTTTFGADGGEMNYYFIYGPEISKVVIRYTQLTGTPELPPMWALGYHQCKWSYYPEAKVKEITQKFRELQIPCDAIYLDIDYMNGFRCFTWDKEKFPAPKQMVADLAKEGFKTIVIIDPGIKIDPEYSVYQQALEQDYFCKRADGDLMKGKVWPGDCHFPDFTNPDVREWWANLYKELIAEIGIKGVWNDMNEPAVFEVESKTFPLDVRHYFEGNESSHRKAHNVYGMQMARATYEGVKRFAYPNRPFIITRAAYSGAQRYTSTWTGDNIATWEHLWLANIQMQRMSMSGMGFIGSDIGGFVEQPTPELYARWIQLGVFHPFCRTHSSGDHGNQEPWSFGNEVTDIVRKFVELRYTLLPYLYTMFWQYATQAVPLLKSLVYYDQTDEKTYFRNDEFLLGNDILVSPIMEPNLTGRRVYLPKGNWYLLWSHQIFEGKKEHYIATAFDEIPVFVKEGAVIPKYPVQQFVGEQTIKVMTFDIYFKNGNSIAHWFDDAHDGYGYEKEQFSLVTFEVTGTENYLKISVNKIGKYELPYLKFVFQFIGLPFAPNEVNIDNQSIKSKITLENNVFSFSTNHLFNTIIIS